MNTLDNSLCPHKKKTAENGNVQRTQNQRNEPISCRYNAMTPEKAKEKDVLDMVQQESLKQLQV